MARGEVPSAISSVKVRVQLRNRTDSTLIQRRDLLDQASIAGSRARSGPSLSKAYDELLPTMIVLLTLGCVASPAADQSLYQNISGLYRHDSQAICCVCCCYFVQRIAQ